jgi:hypothetical protein
VPKRIANRLAGDPAQTSITAFQGTGSEPFVDGFHWSSTEGSASDAWELGFGNGVQRDGFKDFGSRVRAFRKFAL